MAGSDGSAKRIKDPDEAIASLGYPRWARYVNSADSYTKPVDWCFSQAAREMDKTQPDDTRQRASLAMEWGRLLVDNQECSEFCTTVANHYNLDKAILYRDIRAKDENEEAFIDRLAAILREDFHFIGVRHGESRKRLLEVWNKHERVTDTIVLNDAEGHRDDVFSVL